MALGPKNTSNTLAEFRNLSFQELDNFVNLCSVTIKDNDVLFMNQAREFNQIYAQVGNNDSKCEAINRKLNFLKHCQNIIELNILATNKYIKEFEDGLSNLECDCCKCHNLNFESLGIFNRLNPQRIALFSVILKINHEMTSYIQDFEELLAKLNVVKERNVKDQGKMVEKILDNQLKQLEHLELNLHKMSTNLEVNNRSFKKIEENGGFSSCPCNDKTKNMS